jgi:hypothetical protein
MNSIKKFAAAIAALALTAAAQATPLAFTTFTSSTGNLATDTIAETTVTGSGYLSFVLSGYKSLDGQNFYEDDFTLSVDGSTLYIGTFGLGGGGADHQYYNAGVTATKSGDAVTFLVPLGIVSDTYTVDFQYTSLSDKNHAGFQGLSDEGWNISKVAVVPEPASIALMLAGLGMIGGLARRRRQG